MTYIENDNVLVWRSQIGAKKCLLTSQNSDNEISAAFNNVVHENYYNAVLKIQKRDRRL